jgi:hypothetical protein
VSLCHLIDLVDVAEGDRNGEILLNLHNFTHILKLTSNELVSKTSHQSKWANSYSFHKMSIKSSFEGGFRISEIVLKELFVISSIPSIQSCNNIRSEQKFCSCFGLGGSYAVKDPKREKPYKLTRSHMGYFIKTKKHVKMILILTGYKDCYMRPISSKFTVTL